MTDGQGAARQRLPDKLAKELRYQIQSLSKTDLSQYTYEHTPSDYKDAKTDYSIYNPDGKLILKGRGFGNRDFFWTPITDVRLTEA